MKTQLLSALFALVLIVPFGSATAENEATAERRVKVVVADHEGETEVLELRGESLEVGESREWVTDSGKVVVITRTEEGFSVTVDGEEIDLGGLPLGGEDGEPVKVIRKIVKTGHGETVDIEGLDELDLESLVLGEGGAHGAHVIRLGFSGLKQHLEESGALEGLSDEQRHRILSAIESYGAGGAAKVIKIETRGDAE